MDAYELIFGPVNEEREKILAAKRDAALAVHGIFADVRLTAAKIADIDCGMDFDTWLEVYGGFEDQPGYAERYGEF